MDKGRLKWTEKYIKHLAKLITHTLWLRLCFYPHYTYENTEAQGAEITPKAFFHGSTGIQIQVYMTPHLLQNHTVCILWEKVTSILAFEYCFLNLEKPLCICYPRAFFFFFSPTYGMFHFWIFWNCCSKMPLLSTLVFWVINGWPFPGTWQLTKGTHLNCKTEDWTK